MSKTLSLTRGYGSFFWGCTKFAVSPYTATFLGVASANGCNEEDSLEHVAAAAAVCGILTFIVPVLPMLTTITTSFAIIAASLAALSMIFTYPIALLADACTAPDIDNIYNNDLWAPISSTI